MGSIPHIYRREGLSPGDPRRGCPVSGNDFAYVAMGVAICAKCFQGQESEFSSEIPAPEFVIIAVVLALELHAA